VGEGGGPGTKIEGAADNQLPAFCCQEFGAKCSAPSCVHPLKLNSAERFGSCDFIDNGPRGTGSEIPRSQIGRDPNDTHQAKSTQKTKGTSPF